VISYTVECEELSLDLRFDADQRCISIFIRDPVPAAVKELVSFPNLRSPVEVEEYAKSNALALVSGPRWLRCDGPTRCLHFEFDGAERKMVTIMSTDVVPPDAS